MTIISPSLLACDFLQIGSELKAFDGAKDLWFHLDIMDGHFVPNLTFGQPIIELIVKRASHKCDAHFMVTNPEFYGDCLKNFGIHNFTFHYEAVSDALKLIKNLKSFYPSVGISIKPQTPVEKLSDEILKQVDLILVMSVEPGFGGQAFITGSIEKIRLLKNRRDELKAHFQIQVDGGVSDQNAEMLILAGADNLVAGSYVFKTTPDNYIAKVDSLRNYKKS